ncbi:MAG: ATP-binding protein [Solidesulfovibrio sp.]
MYNKEAFPGGCVIRFAAGLKLVDRAVAETVAFIESRNVTGSLFEVKLLLREALLNAVIHGSGLNPARTVVLEVLTAEGRLSFSVTDQGPGFDWRAGRATLPPPEALSGRGLAILTIYADDVRFNAAGNNVTLTKTVTGLRGPATVSDDVEKSTTRSVHMPDIRIEDGVAVLCPAGDIVASGTDALRAQIRDLLAEHPGRLVLDLSRVEVIDSMGIGLLIAAHNTLGKKGERLILLNASRDLAALLRTMRLDKHFSVQID